MQPPASLDAPYAADTLVNSASSPNLFQSVIEFQHDSSFGLARSKHTASTHELNQAWPQRSHRTRYLMT